MWHDRPFLLQSVKMYGQKRPLVRSEPPLFSSVGTSSSGDTVLEKKAKCQVTISTFEKWQRTTIMTWLRCDKDEQDKSLVALRWCSACREYQSRIHSMKNYSSVWVTGSENQQTSNVLDHVSCDQHKAAMSHLCAAQAKARKEPVTSYAPIAHALLMLE